MVTVLNFKHAIDLPKWRPVASNGLGGSTINGVHVSDFRNNLDVGPFIYHMVRVVSSTTFFAKYDTNNDQWSILPSPAFMTTALSSLFLMSAQGPRGTIAAGATTTSIPLTTPLPATVGVDQLANRGDGIGFKIRIIGNSAGSSGKIEERLVVANTGETVTPTLILDSPLSFVPANGNAYEFLSGRIFILGSSNAATNWRYFDILTNSYSANLATANLPASWTDSNQVGLDELLVPYDRNPGEGFFGTLTATATAAASLTGQAAGGDAEVLANEHRNFQIRIIEDITIPTAVGQRRNITSHTAGASPVYTVPAWTVQPSATASYVIENNGDRIIAWMNGTTQTSTYTISGNAWDANITFAARPVAPGIGLISHQAFSIEPDIAKNARHSFIFSFRGAAITLDLFDIAGAATGLWTAGITYGNNNVTLGSGGSTQDPATNQGRYIYIFISPQTTYRFDMKNRVLESQTFLRIPGISIGSAWKALGWTVFIDGSTKLSIILLNGTTGSPFTPLVFTLPIIR